MTNQFFEKPILNGPYGYQGQIDFAKKVEDVFNTMVNGFAKGQTS